MNAYAIFVLLGILGLVICLLFALMFSYYFLLMRIATKYPAYYMKIGSPFLPTDSRSITKTIRRDKYNYKLLKVLLTGPPKDFPNDSQLKRLARHIQFELCSIILLIIAGITLAFKI